MTFIKLPHSIWSLDLPPNAFRTYCVLLRFANQATNMATVSMRKLAVSAGISEKSISRGVEELIAKDIVMVTTRHFQGHHLAHQYKLMQFSGGFTMLPVHVLRLPISSAALKLFAFLCKCMDRDRKAFPSLNWISKWVGITVKTVINHISRLCSLGLLRKKNYIKKDRSYGHNQYTVLFENKKIIEKTCLQRTSIHSQNKTISKNNLTIAKIWQFVKFLFFSLVFLFGGTVILSEQEQDPYYCITIEKEKLKGKKMDY